MRCVSPVSELKIRQIKHVEAVLQLLSVMEHDDRFVEAIYRTDGKENKNMCDVLDVVEKRGRKEGRTEGRTEGRAEGKALIMRKMYEKGYMIKEIAQITDESEETIKDILQVL